MIDHKQLRSAAPSIIGIVQECLIDQSLSFLHQTTKLTDISPEKGMYWTVIVQSILQFNEIQFIIII
jgi:hypothetical protein